MNHGENVQPALLNAFLLTTKDSLLVFEAARRGICPVITRRLHESEKATMIVSGSIFAFDEQATGIKRWTDGTLWSPSRIIGNYLVYRELEKKGERGAAQPARPAEPIPMAQASGSAASYDPFEQFPTSAGLQGQEGTAASTPIRSTASGSTGLQRDIERALIGSLTSSYMFKKNGLVKKTISNGRLHLISYYSIDDVVSGRLRAPSSLIELTSLELSPALLEPKNFRLPPVTEHDSEGNLKYVGEEADPTMMPNSLEPLVSPTFSHRQVVDPNAIVPSMPALGLAATVLNPLSSTYQEPEETHSFASDESTEPVHDAFQGQLSVFQEAEFQLVDPGLSSSYGADFRSWPAEVQPQLLPQQQNTTYPIRSYSASPSSYQAPLPTRPYSARPAPQARTIYRTNPYQQRRVSETGVHCGFAQPQSAPPVSMPSTSARSQFPQHASAVATTPYTHQRLSYDRMDVPGYQAQSAESSSSSPTLPIYQVTQPHLQAVPPSHNVVRWTPEIANSALSYAQPIQPQAHTSGHLRSETYPHSLPQHQQVHPHFLPDYASLHAPQTVRQSTRSGGETSDRYNIEQHLPEQSYDWQ